MRIVFMGTPEFAVSTLETLYECGQDVVLAVTQPDRPKGRGYVMTPSPVKVCALEHGTNVITPEKMRDESVIKALEEANADMFIVTAFGKILPQSVLDIPPLGCVNVHASLLPKLRGAAPINRAIMNGDELGGVTLMYMDAGMDTGDMIISETVGITPELDAGTYHDLLAQAGSKCLKKFLKMLENGEKIPRVKQNGEEATYAPKITNEETRIDFDLPAKEVYNKIRGLSPFPGAYFTLEGKRIKVLKAALGDKNGEPGTVICTAENGIGIACAGGCVMLEVICPEGKKPTDCASYLRGHSLPLGTRTNG